MSDLFKLCKQCLKLLLASGTWVNSMYLGKGNKKKLKQEKIHKPFVTTTQKEMVTYFSLQINTI